MEIVSYATIQSMFPGEVGNAQDGIDSTKSLLSSIMGIVRIVGITVAVVMLAVIACKYMTSAPGDRSDLNKVYSYLCYRCTSIVWRIWIGRNNKKYGF